MRIRIVQSPPETSIDGIRLDRFELGGQYEVGNNLGALFLAEGWATPVELDEPPLPVPFSETDPFDPRRLYHPPGAKPDPTNLVRDTYPPHVNRNDKAAEFKRRRRKRR